MSDTNQNDSDRALARLLDEALRPSGGAGDSACPDVEMLAAYAEHNLDGTENAHLEKHFAGCARCQKILAVLTVSGEEPLNEAEVERFGRRVAVAAVGVAGSEPRTAESKKVVPFARPRTAWRWLAPAAGIAAAAALWIALRPTPQHGTSVITAQKTIDQSSALSSVQDQGGDSLEARAEVPAPPAAATREAEARQQLKSLAPAQPQAKKSDQAANVPQALPGAASGEGGASAASQAVGALQGTARPATTPDSPEARSSDELAAAPSTQTAAPGPASVAQAKSAANRQVQAFAAGGIGGGLAGRGPVVLASPNRSVLWRLGLAGRIELSTDQGRTWQQQSSGVTGDLLAGAAPSDKVAWIAGRAGVVLRTTDGEHWQRVAPADAGADWTGIEASDALHATITSSDRRRFATDDGGQTWKQQ